MFVYFVHMIANFCWSFPLLFVGMFYIATGEREEILRIELCNYKSITTGRGFSGWFGIENYLKFIS